jgi:hypothetical protein
MIGSRERLRHIALQPEKLRRFHFGRNPAADIAQNLVSAGVDLFGFARGPVIHPDDDVAAGVPGRAHCDRSGIALDGDERTRRIEPHSRDAGYRNAGGGNRFPDAVADGRPYLVARLLHDAACLVPDGDRTLGGSQEATALVEDPCACATRSDVDTEKKPRHL